MKLLSIQVGRPRDVEWQGKSVSTGIFKQAVPGPVMVRRLNIEGDGQADLTVHGGVDKAVYGYSRDAYPWWDARLKQRLTHGAFGENLTIEKLDEKDLCIGDTIALGECELQVSEPRFPCFKLGLKFNDVGVLKTFIESGRPGIYFRVVREGKIEAGQTLKILDRDPRRISVDTFFLLKIGKLKSREALEKLLSMDNLGAEWREKFSGFLKKY